MDVNNFLELVIDIFLFLINQSPRKPVVIDTTHIAAYGNDDHNPFPLILKCSTSLMYFGRSVTMIKNPQS